MESNYWLIKLHHLKYATEKSKVPKILVTDVEALRACEEVVEIHEDANAHIHESHEDRMAPTTKPTQFEI